MRTIRTSKIELDSTKQIREDADSLAVPVILTRESILPFADGKGYRPAKELQEAAWTLEGAWVVAFSHIDTVFVTNRADIQGKVEGVKFCSKINGVVGDVRFLKANCDAKVLDGVKKGELKDVSVAYFCEDVFRPGKFGDEPYDFVQQNFMFGHVAVGVPEGRCPSPFCGMAVDQLCRKPALFPMVEIQGMDSKQLEEIMGKDAFKNMQPRAVFFPATSHGDPEVTEKYVRIRVRDPNLFVDGSFRTIVLSAKEGIHAIIGKLKSDPKGATVVQNYMFEVAKEWTMEKAQAWVKDHKDAVAAKELSVEELKTKVEDLNTERAAIIEKLYPRPARLPEVEERKFQLDLSLLDAQIHALMQVLAEKVAGVESEGNGASEPGKPKTDALDPAAVLERSSKLLSSR